MTSLVGRPHHSPSPTSVQPSPKRSSHGKRWTRQDTIEGASNTELALAQTRRWIEVSTSTILYSMRMEFSCLLHHVYNVVLACVQVIVKCDVCLLACNNIVFHGKLALRNGSECINSIQVTVWHSSNSFGDNLNSQLSYGMLHSALFFVVMQANFTATFYIQYFK